MKLTQSTIERVLDADIVEVVKHYIPELKKTEHNLLNDTHSDNV